jgi:beta-mannosidase
MIRQSLSGTWKLRQRGSTEWIRAQVPGSVFLSLFQEGKIKDPFQRENEKAVKKLSFFDYEYERVFRIEPQLLQEETVEIVFYGIDTLGEIYLNDQFIGATANMHHAHCFPVRKALVEGDNILKVILHSPSKYAEEQNRILPLRSAHGAMPGAAYLRKAHYMFGWDWGPQLPDLGIWKDVELRGYSHILIEDVLFRRFYRGTDVDIEISIGLTRSPAGNEILAVQILSPNGDVSKFQIKPKGINAVGKVTIHDAELWFPSGYGSQPLYKVHISLETPLQEVLDERNFRIGLRTLVLDQTPDPEGVAFRFIVNGIPLFARGADLIPPDSLITRRSPEQLYALVDNCQKANFNMLRIWEEESILMKRFWTPVMKKVSLCGRI